MFKVSSQWMSSALQQSPEPAPCILCSSRNVTKSSKWRLSPLQRLPGRKVGKVWGKHSPHRWSWEMPVGKAVIPAM